MLLRLLLDIQVSLQFTFHRFSFLSLPRQPYILSSLVTHCFDFTVFTLFFSIYYQYRINPSPPDNPDSPVKMKTSFALTTFIFSLALAAPHKRQQNLQTFTGALGGIAATPVTDSGNADRPFQVKGDTFVGIGAALQRSCDQQCTYLWTRPFVLSFLKDCTDFVSLSQRLRERSQWRRCNTEC